MATLLQIENLTKSYGDRMLFADATFGIDEGGMRGHRPGHRKPANLSLAKRGSGSTCATRREVVTGGQCSWQVF